MNDLWKKLKRPCFRCLYVRYKFYNSLFLITCTVRDFEGAFPWNTKLEFPIFQFIPVFQIRNPTVKNGKWHLSTMWTPMIVQSAQVDEERIAGCGKFNTVVHQAVWYVA